MGGGIPATEGRASCPIYSQLLGQCLAHSRCLVKICPLNECPDTKVREPAAHSLVIPSYFNKVINNSYELLSDDCVPRQWLGDLIMFSHSPYD